VRRHWGWAAGGGNGREGKGWHAVDGWRGSKAVSGGVLGSGSPWLSRFPHFALAFRLFRNVAWLGRH